jgi:hypothetical protein
MEERKGRWEEGIKDRMKKGRNKLGLFIYDLFKYADFT